MSGGPMATTGSEILAAFNALLLFAVALYILGEAYQRFLHTPEVHPTGMLVIAGRIGWSSIWSAFDC